MTETSCLISITPLGDPTAGHVGAPTPACEVKLADLPEMGYTNADAPNPRGEVRGRCGAGAEGGAAAARPPSP
jgi:long-chain acyl-CoA synthetase